jgi:hypothetical protein
MKFTLVPVAALSACALTIIACGGGAAPSRLKYGTPPASSTDSLMLAKQGLLGTWGLLKEGCRDAEGAEHLGDVTLPQYDGRLEFVSDTLARATTIETSESGATCRKAGELKMEMQPGNVIRFTHDATTVSGSRAGQAGCKAEPAGQRVDVATYAFEGESTLKLAVALDEGSDACVAIVQVYDRVGR